MQVKNARTVIQPYRALAKGNQNQPRGHVTKSITYFSGAERERLINLTQQKCNIIHIKCGAMMVGVVQETGWKQITGPLN
jgi:hypothetical protein